MAPGNPKVTIVNLVNQMEDSDLKTSLQRLVEATGRISDSVQQKTLVQRSRPIVAQPTSPAPFTNHQIHPELFAAQAQEQLDQNQRQAQQSSSQTQPLEDMIDPRLKELEDSAEVAINPLLHNTHQSHEYQAFQQLADYGQSYGYGHDHAWNPPTQQGQYYGDPIRHGHEHDPSFYQHAWHHQQMGGTPNEAGDLLQPEIYQWDAGESQSGYVPEQPQIPRYGTDAKLPQMGDMDHFYGHQADGRVSLNRSSYYPGQ